MEGRKDGSIDCKSVLLIKLSCGLRVEQDFSWGSRMESGVSRAQFADVLQES